MRRRYQVLVNRNKVHLQQENARPPYHTETMTKIQELGVIELLPHRAYIPDIAPSDHHLFRSMTHFLRGKNLENFEAVEVGLTEFLASETRHLYTRGMINLAERCLKTIEFDGFYFDK